MKNLMSIDILLLSVSGSGIKGTQHSGRMHSWKSHEDLATRAFFSLSGSCMENMAVIMKVGRGGDLVCFSCAHIIIIIIIISLIIFSLSTCKYQDMYTPSKKCS
jgi:hypothetical protein